MKAKTKEMSEARHLRGEGRSLNEIALLTGCSKGTVSVWVRDIVLNAKQRELLDSQPYTTEAIRARAEGHRRSAREKRESSQTRGRTLAREGSRLHLMGCMLYWTEGGKQRNLVSLGNTDVEILRLFLRFLREDYRVPNARIRIHITAHTDIHCAEDIEAFWIRTLGLDGAILAKHEFNPPKRPGRNPGKVVRLPGKRPYGTCTLIVCDTEIVQSIYGGICEYAGIPTQEEWLDGIKKTHPRQVAVASPSGD